MTLSANEIRLLRQDRVNLALFLRAEVGGEIIRLYAGVGDFPLPAGPVETDGGIYRCVGRWAEGMPEVDHLMNGQAQAITLTLTGLDRETAKAWLIDRALVIGAPATMGWMVLDERHRPGGPVHWPIRGGLSQPRLTRTKVSDTLWNRSVSVVLMAGAAGRRRPAWALLSGPDQRRRSPSDAACDGVGTITVETTRRWPN